MSIFLLSFTLFVMSVFLSKSEFMNRFTKAEAQLNPSAKNSLLLAYPLLTQSDGKSKARIDVFVRNENLGKEPEPIANRRVKLNTTLGQIDQGEIVSDKNGQATFYLSSDKPGTAQVSAIVDGSITLDQKVSVEFK